MKLFIHTFYYKIKMMLHDKTGTFWMIFYPLIMALLFYVSFGTEGNNGMGYDFDPNPVSVTGSNEAFLTAAEESELFVITFADADEAEKLLAEGKITAAFLLTDGKLSVECRGNGFEESIVRIFADTYSQMVSTATNVAMKNPKLIMTGELEGLISRERSFTENVPLKNTGNLALYYFSLIGMTAVMCCTLSVSNIDAIQANQCTVAARTVMSPASRMIIFFSHSLATMLFHYSSLMLSIIFMKYVLGVNFGEGTLGYIALICAAGVFFGVMFGSLVCAAITKKQTIKNAVLIALSIIGAFFAGMMNVNIAHNAAKTFPLIKQINPVTLVADGLYSLYYYDTYDMLYKNIFLLTAYGVVATILTVIILRRQKYASI